jgi:hypothetical protein
MINRKITGNCETCKQCGDCKGDGPTPDWVDSPCDICDPCASLQHCSYCGNGSCICDLMVETEEGIMHKGCYELQIAEIKKKAKRIGPGIDRAARCLPLELDDPAKVRQCSMRIASALRDSCKRLPIEKSELIRGILENIEKEIKIDVVLKNIELAMAYTLPVIEAENNEIINLLKNIEFGVSKLNFSSGSTRQDICKLKTSIESFQKTIETHGLSMEELEEVLKEKDNAIVERLEKTREDWLLTVDEIVKGLPSSGDADRILKELQGLKQSSRRDILGIAGDLSSIIGLFTSMISLAIA